MKQVIFCTVFYSLQFIARTQKPMNAFGENTLPFEISPWWTPQLKKTEISPIMREIVGFSTKFSYSPDETVNFKLNIQLKYLKRGEVFPDISIYRLGYYRGHGARLLGKATVLYPLKTQPNCSFDQESRMVDCSNWIVSAQWRIPIDSVSGVYIAVPMFRLSSQYSSHMRKNENFHKNFIPFVVRQLSNSLGSDILFKVSDLTWVAYNLYGGWNLYRGGRQFSFASRAKKVSYDRPFANRLPEPLGKQQNFLFGTEYPSIYWLEKQGFHVSYASCSDVEELNLYGMLSRDRYRVLLSVGHDEYWTPELREAHLVARDNGIHIAFFSGNEAFWRVLWKEKYTETVITSVAQSPARPIFQFQDGERRVVVCRKETIDGVALSNASHLWTGTFIDPRFRPAEHQHSLTGQYFMVNAMRRDRMTVSRRDGSLRFWRNTTAAWDDQMIPTSSKGKVIRKKDSSNGRKYRHLLKNEGDDVFRPDDRLDDIAYTSSPGLLGYEWDASIDDCHRPNGMFTLSHTTIPVEKALMETYGAAYKGNGTLTHKLSLYRHIKFRIPSVEDEQFLLSALKTNSICSNQSIAIAERQSEQQHRSPGALVFGAGTVQWAWALSDFRDGEQMGEDYTIQQATLNLLADMGVFPHPTSFKMNNIHNSTHRLVFPMQSTDTEPPKSRITWNAAQRYLKRAVLTENSTLRIRGTAADFGGGSIAGVEVSLNGGRTWHAATGRDTWTYVHRFRGPPASLADTSDCSTFRSDGDSAVSSYRSGLIQRGQLYDDYLTYTSTSQTAHAMVTTMVIISRAVDDSGWREHIHDGLHALCHLTSPRKLPANIIIVPIKIK